MTVDVQDLNTIVRKENKKFQRAQEEISKIVVGQKHLIESLFIAILADGHILLEGLPGLAKTLAVTTLAKVVNCKFKRIQFTPDLLPADLLGTTIFNPKEGTFSIKKGPLFTNIALADEINRAPAKVQSALLEVMAEKQITISGRTFKLDAPFLVLATQNPIDQEGTYPLPEAQKDRFMMKVKVVYPHRDEEREMLSRMGRVKDKPNAEALISSTDILEARGIVDDIYIDEKITEYILDIVFATRYPERYYAGIEGLIEVGASPRATLALTAAAKARAFLDGRGFVTPHDVKRIGPNVLRHRLKLSYEAEAEEKTTDDIIDKIFDTLPVP